MRCAQVPAALVLLIAAALPAAPIFEGGVEFADDHKSIAGIRELRIHVLPLHASSRALRLRRAKIEAFFRKELEESGIKVVTNEEAPRCTLNIISHEDVRFPDAVSLCTLIEIEQQVRVHRIEQDLTVATVAFIDVFLAHKREAWTTLKARITLCVAALGNSVGGAKRGG